MIEPLDRSYVKERLVYMVPRSAQILPFDSPYLSFSHLCSSPFPNALTIGSLPPLFRAKLTSQDNNYPFPCHHKPYFQKELSQTSMLKA